MSTRSPQNKRNQEKLQGSMTGMARKSAASAKPARPAAASVRVVSASAKAQRAARERGEDLSNLTREEKRARRQEQRMAEDRIYQASAILLKEDEAYAGYRKIWWAMLGVGIGGLIVSVILMAVRSRGRGGRRYAAARDDRDGGGLHRRDRGLHLRFREDSSHPQQVPFCG